MIESIHMKLEIFLFFQYAPRGFGIDCQTFRQRGFRNLAVAAENHQANPLLREEPSGCAVVGFCPETVCSGTSQRNFKSACGICRRFCRNAFVFRAPDPPVIAVEEIEPEIKACRSLRLDMIDRVVQKEERKGRASGEIGQKASGASVERGIVEVPAEIGERIVQFCLVVTNVCQGKIPEAETACLRFAFCVPMLVTDFDSDEFRVLFSAHIHFRMSPVCRPARVAGGKMRIQCSACRKQGLFSSGVFQQNADVVSVVRPVDERHVVEELKRIRVVDGNRTLQENPEVFVCGFFFQREFQAVAVGECGGSVFFQEPLSPCRDRADGGGNGENGPEKQSCNAGSFHKFYLFCFSFREQRKGPAGRLLLSARSHSGTRPHA